MSIVCTQWLIESWRSWPSGIAQPDCARVRLEGGGINRGTTQISFTWRLTDVPGWARNPAFANIEGMAKPAEEEAEAVQTNKGWEVQDEELRE